jgi:hypothetical protein
LLLIAAGASDNDAPETLPVNPSLEVALVSGSSTTFRRSADRE